MFDFLADMDGLQKTFLITACIFSLLFIWQLIAALIGLSAGEDFDLDHSGDVGDVDGHVDVDSHDFDHDSTSGDFSGLKLLSLRSILAFCLLFSWAGFFYMWKDNVRVPLALVYSAAWGLAAMVVVSWGFWQMSKLQESGNKDIRTCLGKEASVYMKIMPGKTGKIRIMVGNSITFCNARSASKVELESGTRVKISKIIDQNTLEVEEI